MRRIIGVLTTLFLICAMTLGALHTAFAPLYGSDSLPIGFASVMRLVLDSMEFNNGAATWQYLDKPLFMFARPITGADVYIFTNWDVARKAIGICNACPGIGQAVNSTTFQGFIDDLEGSGWHKLTREQVPQLVPSTAIARATLAMSILRAMAFSETLLTVIPITPSLMPMPVDVQS